MPNIIYEPEARKTERIIYDPEHKTKPITAPTTEPKKEAKKEDISLPDIVKDIAMDLAFMGVGSLIGGGVGAAIRLPALAERALMLARLISRAPKLVGETAGLATSYYLRDTDAEKSIKGAIETQAIGLAISPAAKVAGKIIKTVTPQPVKETLSKAKEKAAEHINSFLYGHDLPKNVANAVINSSLNELRKINILNKNANRELNKFLKEDYRNAVNLVYEELKRNQTFLSIQSDNIKKLTDEQLQTIFAKLLNVRIDNAHPHIVIEQLKLLEEVGSKEAKEFIANLNQKYPVIFKQHDFYKKSTEDYFSLLDEYLKETETNRLLVENLTHRDAINKIQEIKNRFTGLLSQEGISTQDIKQTSDGIKNLIEQFSEVKNILSSEGRAALAELNKAYRKFSKISSSSLKEFKKIQDTLTKSVEGLTSAHQILQNEFTRIGEHQRKTLENVLNGLNTIRGYISQLITGKPQEVRNILANIRQAVKSVVSATREESPLPKETKKLIKDAIRNVANAIKDIQKLYVFRTGMSKEYYRSITSAINKLDKAAELFSKSTIKDIRKGIEFLHKVYYTRQAMAPKFILRRTAAEETPEAVYEWSLENVLNQFRGQVLDVAQYLKQRKYPTLLGKYAEELLVPDVHEIVYKNTAHDVANAVKNTYILPSTIKRVRDIFEDLYKTGTTIKHELAGYIDESGKTLSVTLPLVVKDLKEIQNVAVSQLYKPVAIGNTTYYVYKDLIEWINHAFSPVFAGKQNIFNLSSREGISLLAGINTLFKRIAVMFAFIHMKALSTAAYGIGSTKELFTAIKSMFKSDKWVREYLEPMEKELIEKIETYKVNTKFVLTSYDDVREMLERAKIHKSLKPVITILDKLGVNKLAGAMDKALWDRLFYAVKLLTANNFVSMFERGSLTKAMLEDYLDKLASVFGGNFEWLFMKPASRELIRLMSFAPDWYLTLTRHAIGALKGHPLFEDFFRRIFILHYVIANDLCWRINGETTYDVYKRTGNFVDLFKVPLYSYKMTSAGPKLVRASINVVGFEIEGFEFLGILPAYDFFHEWYSTQESADAVAKRVAGKWAKYLSTKESTLLRFLGQIKLLANTELKGNIIDVLPVPILASTIRTVVGKRTTFSEAGEKIPAGLIAFLYQLGLKYTANQTVAGSIRNQLSRRMTRQEAYAIIEDNRKQLDLLRRKMQSIRAPMSLRTDNINFDTYYKGALTNYISEAFDIVGMYEKGMSPYQIANEIANKLEGTGLSYYPKFRSILTKAVINKIKSILRSKRVEETE